MNFWNHLVSSAPTKLEQKYMTFFLHFHIRDFNPEENDLLLDSVLQEQEKNHSATRTDCLASSNSLDF